MSSLFSTLAKHLVTGNVAVTLGTSGDIFDSITFYGAKANGADNTGNVTISPITPITGVSAVTIAPGESETLLAPAGTTLTASQFELNGANSADGVLCLFFDASTTSWNLLESKVEEASEALVRTVPHLVAECSITRGFDTDTQSPNRISCHCESATIRELSSPSIGNYDCKLTVRITSQADAYTGASSSFDPLAKHWERVAYVRDLFTDELTCQALSRFVDDFEVIDASRGIDARNFVEDRTFVTEFSVMLVAVGQNLN